MTGELLPWAARKRWHTRWHRPISRDAAGVLHAACGVVMQRTDPLLQAPRATRRAFCTRCDARVLGPTERRHGRRIPVASGQMRVWA